jgi:hypothetical protein
MAERVRYRDGFRDPRALPFNEMCSSGGAGCMVGTVVEVRIIAPNSIGKVVRHRIRRGRLLPG